MNDKDWLILKTIFEEKNVTKAAERLYISQPALTYRIKSLEKEFGADLLLRTATGVAFTPEGEHLLTFAKEMMLNLNKTKETIQDMKDKVCGTLRLGTSSVFAHYELPNILKGFIKLYPAVEISLKTGLSQRIHRMLQKEEITVAIVRGDHYWTEEKILLREEPICLVSSTPVEIADLPRKPRIDYITDAPLQAMVGEWWHQTFSEPPLVTMEVDNMDTCRQMVLHGLGWAVLPALGLRSSDNIFKKELFGIDGKPLRRRTWLMCRNSSLQFSTISAFTEFIEKTKASWE